MCLRLLKSKKPTVQKLKVRKDGYIRLWKVFDVKTEGYLVAVFQKYDFYEGKNTAKGEIIKNYRGNNSHLQYAPGFHCFLTKADATKWGDEANGTGRKRTVVPVKVRKSWITTVGMQWQKTAVVCKHIYIERKDIK